MKILDAERTAAALPFERLIPALRDAFVTGAQVPALLTGRRLTLPVMLKAASAIKLSM